MQQPDANEAFLKLVREYISVVNQDVSVSWTRTPGIRRKEGEVLRAIQQIQARRQQGRMFGEEA